MLLVNWFARDFGSEQKWIRCWWHVLTGRFFSKTLDSNLRGKSKLLLLGMCHQIFYLSHITLEDSPNGKSFSLSKKGVDFSISRSKLLLETFPLRVFFILLAHWKTFGGTAGAHQRSIEVWLDLISKWVILQIQQLLLLLNECLCT